MASIRKAFVKKFGEDQAKAIEAAAQGHANGVNDGSRGSDPFKWALLIAIGYQCIELDDYRSYHGITAPWAEVKQWMIDHAKLDEHDGDVDYLTAFSGGYDEYMPHEQAA